MPHKQRYEIFASGLKYGEMLILICVIFAKFAA